MSENPPLPGQTAIGRDGSVTLAIANVTPRWGYCAGPGCTAELEPAKLHRGGGSRPREYCSNACRQRAYRWRLFRA